MYFSKINHLHACLAVGFSVVMATAFKYFGIKSIYNPLNLDIRSTRPRAIKRITYNCLCITTPLFEYLPNYFIALKQKNLDSCDFIGQCYIFVAMAMLVFVTCCCFFINVYSNMSLIYIYGTNKQIYLLLHFIRFML